MKITQTQEGVLKAFREEIPSIYFSDKSVEEFNAYKNNMYYFYRDLMKFPPELFQNKSLLDFGAGTGENTIYLENWGANCTLIEMNPDAHKIQKEVFEKYATKSSNQFINTSIYEYEAQEPFDIVHSRGVFAHTNNPELAFKKLASNLKVSGYLIYGDGNKSGNFQNMLQRIAIFNYSNEWDKMVEVAEILFKEDLDRSQKFINRTRRSIIFDKWVVPRLTQPSVKEVFNWFKENNIKFYNCYPNLIPNFLGDSLHHRPHLDILDMEDLTSIPEAFWLIQNKMDLEVLPNEFAGIDEFEKSLDEMTSYVDDVNLEDEVNLNHLVKISEKYCSNLSNLNLLKDLKNRTMTFHNELVKFIEALNSKSVNELKDLIDSFEHLFRGSQGNRHIDFIGYKQ